MGIIHNGANIIMYYKDNMYYKDCETFDCIIGLLIDTKYFLFECGPFKTNH